MQCYCTLERLQYSVKITFTCTGKPKNLCDLPLCNTHFTAVIGNQTHNTSKVCLYILFIFIHLLSVSPLLKWKFERLASVMTKILSSGTPPETINSHKATEKKQRQTDGWSTFGRKKSCKGWIHSFTAFSWGFMGRKCNLSGLGVRKTNLGNHVH